MLGLLLLIGRPGLWATLVVAQTIYGHALLSASTVLCPSVFPSRGCSGIHHDLVLGISVSSLPHHYFHNRHGHWATIFRVHLSPDCSLRCLVILLEVSPCGGASRGETSLRTIFEIKKITRTACHTFKHRHLDIHSSTHTFTHTHTLAAKCDLRSLLCNYTTMHSDVSHALTTLTLTKHTQRMITMSTSCPLVTIIKIYQVLQKKNKRMFGQLFSCVFFYLFERSL